MNSRAAALVAAALVAAALAELLLQLAKKVSPASFSTGLALGCVDGLRPQGTQG